MTNRIPKYRHTAFKRQSGICFYCGFPMWEQQPSRFAAKHGLPLELAILAHCTAEHVKAKSEGGTDAKNNIVAACTAAEPSTPASSAINAPSNFCLKNAT